MRLIVSLLFLPLRILRVAFAVAVWAMLLVVLGVALGLVHV